MSGMKSGVHRRLVVFVVLTVVALSAVVLFVRDQQESAEATEVASPVKVVASIPYWDQDRAFQSFQQHAQSINFISLFWYTIDRNGNMVPFQDAKIEQNIITFAHQHGVKVFLLIANLPDEVGTTWDAQRVDGIMKDKQQRDRFIGQVVNILAARQADGLTLDFQDTDEQFPVYHFCFRVRQEEFDSILGRIKAAGIKYRSTVRGPVDMQIDPQYGNIYWNEPDGHQWEILTVSYARQTR